MAWINTTHSVDSKQTFTDSRASWCLRSPSCLPPHGELCLGLAHKGMHPGKCSRRGILTPCHLSYLWSSEREQGPPSRFIKLWTFLLGFKLRGIKGKLFDTNCLGVFSFSILVSTWGLTDILLSQPVAKLQEEKESTWSYPADRPVCLSTNVHKNQPQDYIHSKEREPRICILRGPWWFWCWW